ncbi:hypothetical protein [Methanooceanicella nereidis]|uniref:hypothetical protein n=1 Tax=Methanooceanicella nereidis TaxID=2052831 RepID=UPI001E5FE756|nr:hypothetical protein [Methanocella sp. CWC-04]
MLAIQSPIIKNDPCLLRVSNVTSALSFYRSACKRVIDEKYLLENEMSLSECNNKGLTCVLEY